MSRPLPPGDACLCGRSRAYQDCCGPLHAGAPAPDAESLMRSRYSAYVRRDPDYLRLSWHPRTCPDALDFDGPPPVWLGLEIRSARTLDPEHAEVEFVARYRIGGGRVVRLRERSRFERVSGRWLYVDGDVS